MITIKCSVGSCGYNSVKESKDTNGTCQCNSISIRANTWKGGNSVYCDSYYKGDKPFGEHHDSDY